MALVLARQSFIFFMEGHEKDFFFKKVRVICNEAEVDSIIKEKINESIKKTLKSLKELGQEFKVEVSYRKYCKPYELEDYPEGKEFELEIEYIRDWKMKKIINELDGNQFAILCKELGISSGEAISKV